MNKISQTTNPETILKEKTIIKDVVGLKTVDEIIFNDWGWGSRVYSFNNEGYFFKFPRSPQVQNEYKYEIEALKLAESIATKVRVQEILWEHPDNSYFGYKGVKGSTLGKVLNDLSINEKQLIGQVLGDFLKQFHKLEMPNVRIKNVNDEIEQIHEWYRSYSSDMNRYFSNNEQNRIYDLVYNVWPVKLAELGSDLVTSHYDLHFENILYSKDGSVGIIDFGDVSCSDRSRDFIELIEDRHIFDSTLEAYGINSAEFKEKINVRQAMIQIINFGFNFDKNDKVNLERIVKKIKTFL